MKIMIIFKQSYKVYRYNFIEPKTKLSQIFAIINKKIFVITKITSIRVGGRLPFRTFTEITIPYIPPHSLD